MTALDLYVPVNPATIKAKQIYRRFAIKRFNDEEVEKKWPEFLNCCRCTKKTDKKFPSKTMLHIEVITHSKGKRIETYRHYCETCRKDYKPHNKRVGGRNY